ncbi:MAG: phosphotransferase family protein [Thalassovita sp.]
MFPDPALVARLRSDHLIADGLDWVPLTGGQTNRLWRVGDVVVKRFAPCDGNPRFPNDPGQEVAILRHLHGLGLAQNLLGHVEQEGVSYLVFQHLSGHSWRAGTAPVAELLRRVHAVSPLSALRQQAGGSGAIERQVAAILPQLPHSLAAQLTKKRPRSEAIDGVSAQALLHGDPVPGNILITPDGVRLIDWQCPAVGDPVEDLALFLSPAMQLIYRGVPLDSAEIATFTDAYGDRATIDRLRAMQPWHHWGMAAYCAWKTARGSRQYARAMALELAALE